MLTVDFLNPWFLLGAPLALVPVIQPPIMKLLTTRRERLIRMSTPPPVSRREKILFPIGAFLICTVVAPGSAMESTSIRSRNWNWWQATKLARCTR
mgnify:CR=1 FL=1